MKLLTNAVVSLVALVSCSSGTFAATSFAVVSSGGTLVRGDEASSAVRTGTGKYSVTFTSGVRNCAFVATLGSTGSTGSPTGFAGLALNPVNNRTVDVQTHSENGNNSDRPFHLIVVCP